MKLLIDIPEHIYEHAKESSEDSRDEFDAMRAIANGIQQESRSENPNTCGDAISRKHLLEEIAMLKKSPWFNENTYGSKVIRKEAVEIVEDVCIKREPSVTLQQRKTQMLDESNFDVNQYEMDLQSAYDCGRASTQQRTGRWIKQNYGWNWQCSECGFVTPPSAKEIFTFCPKCGAKMEVDS